MTSYRSHSFTCTKCGFAFNRAILASFNSFGLSPEEAQKDLEANLDMFDWPKACLECGHEELLQGEPLDDKPFL